MIDMKLLDIPGLRHLISWIKSCLSAKQDTITPGAGLKMDGNVLSSKLPIKYVTAEEYASMTEEERNADVIYATEEDRSSRN